MKRDEGKDPTTLNNITLSQGLVANIVVSLAMNPGQIVTKPTSRLASFFNYDLKAFENIRDLSTLMPDLIGSNHNLIMSNIIQRGSSNIIKQKHNSYLKDRNGFIIPIMIFIDHSFTSLTDM